MKSIRNPQYLEFISRLRSMRKKLNVSQIELAKKLSKPQSYISKVETGERRIDLIESLEICTALGVDLNKVIPKNLKKEIANKRSKKG